MRKIIHIGRDTLLLQLLLMKVIHLFEVVYYDSKGKLLEYSLSSILYILLKFQSQAL